VSKFIPKPPGKVDSCVVVLFVIGGPFLAFLTATVVYVRGA
jgi:hypothetical protein